MFLTNEQICQVQKTCERVSNNRTRTGEVTIQIINNMPRNLFVREPVYDEEHVLIGYTTQLYRFALPESELEKKRQRNRRKPKIGNE